MCFVCFVAPEQNLSCGQFVSWLYRACVGTRASISLNFSRPGVVSTMFCGSRTEVVLRQFFVTWLCRACVKNQGLNFAKIFTPWSCLHCILWLQSRSCFMTISVTWLCRACVGTRFLISLKFSRPGLVYTVFCDTRAGVVLRQFLLPDSLLSVC